LVELKVRDVVKVLDIAGYQGEVVFQGSCGNDKVLKHGRSLFSLGVSVSLEVVHNASPQPLRRTRWECSL
jgi:hypothetical protein